MEVDVPGHTASIAQLYSEHVACLDRNNEWPKYAAEPPTGACWKLRSICYTTEFGEVQASFGSVILKPRSSLGGSFRASPECSVVRTCQQEETKSCVPALRLPHPSFENLLHRIESAIRTTALLKRVANRIPKSTLCFLTLSRTFTTVCGRRARHPSCGKK